jgi:hypothetical protein
MSVHDLFFAAGGIGGSGRVGATLAAAVGLVSVVVGGLALARAGGRRAGALLAVAAGLAGAVLSVWHLAQTTEGFGTGQGRAGAIIGLVLGVVGVNLGGLALGRTRRAG